MCQFQPAFAVRISLHILEQFAASTNAENAAVSRAESNTSNQDNVPAISPWNKTVFAAAVCEMLSIVLALTNCKL